MKREIVFDPETDGPQMARAQSWYSTWVPVPGVTVKAPPTPAGRATLERKHARSKAARRGYRGLLDALRQQDGPCKTPD